MRALTFNEFKDTCSAKKDGCNEKCSMEISMCRHLFLKAIGPHLAKQMLEEQKAKRKEC